MLAYPEYKPLLDAVEEGNIERVRQAVAAMAPHANYDNYNGYPYKALEAAAKADRADMVEALLSKGKHTHIRFIMRQAGFDRSDQPPSMNVLRHLVDTLRFAEFTVSTHSADDLGYELSQSSGARNDRSQALALVIDKALEIGKREGKLDEVKKKIAHGLSGALHDGSTENFKAILARTDDADLPNHLLEIAKWGIDESKPEFANLAEKVGLLADRINDPAVLHQALTNASHNGTPRVHKVLLERVQHEDARHNAVIAAAHGSLDTGRSYATQNLRQHFDTHSVSDDALFKAMEAAIAQGQIPQLKQLAARAQAQSPALLNRPTGDDDSLLVKAVEHTNPDLALQMANILVDNGAAPDKTGNGKNPRTILTKRGLGDDDLARGMQASREAAHIGQKLQMMIDVLRRNGLEPKDMAPILAASMGGESNILPAPEERRPTVGNVTRALGGKQAAPGPRPDL